MRRWKRHGEKNKGTGGVIYRLNKQRAACLLKTTSSVYTSREEERPGSIKQRVRANTARCVAISVIHAYAFGVTDNNSKETSHFCVCTYHCSTYHVFSVVSTTILPCPPAHEGLVARCVRHLYVRASFWDVVAYVES